MDFRQRLEQSRNTAANSSSHVEPTEPAANRYFSTDNGNRINCLDLRLPEGARKALPYALITEINFDLDSGIEILAQGKTITIKGRNLIKLYDYLIAYRVRYIQANVGIDPEEEGLFVKEIFIGELA